MAIGFGFLAIYIGIVRARNLSAFELVGWLLAGGASFAGYHGYINGYWPELVSLVIAIQILAAGLLRWIAITRWREVDWLEFRPYRFGLTKQD